jgi:hypothetical protein
VKGVWVFASGGVDIVGGVGVLRGDGRAMLWVMCVCVYIRLSVWDGCGGGGCCGWRVYQG